MTNKDNKSDPNDISAQEILDFLRGGDGVPTSSSTKDVSDIKEEEKNIFSSDVSINNKDVNENNNGEGDNSKVSLNPALKPSEVFDSRDPTMYFDKMFSNTPNDPVKAILKDLKDVTITETEKETYLRSILLSTRFETKIHLKNDISISMQSKLISEQDEIAHRLEKFALEKGKDNNLVHSPMDVYKYALKLNIIFANPFINNTPVFDANLTIDEKSDFMETFPSAKWLLLINAVRIFERKENLLSQFILDEDF